MMVLQQYIANKVRVSRAEAGMTQEQMAEKLNITRRTYSNIENGKCDVRINMLVSIAEVTQQSFTWFIPTDNKVNKHDLAC